jgi:fatty acid CoA ligase FadD9
MPGFREVHGARPGRIREDDLRLDRFLAPAELEAAAGVAARELPERVRTVLLTGASGFLGRALALAWLERLAPEGGRVLALVRAPDAAAATARLKSLGGDADPRLAERFTALADDRLEALAGDLARPDLGLAPEAYERLAEEVDLIVHPAALVNHVLAYEQLFAPNVAGTAQLIRLALRRRPKRFDFVSTVGVLAGARAPGRVSELAGVDALQPDWPARGGYAHGYALSKWAGEVLLRDLHERFQTPVRVFRCDLLLPDRRYRRQINLPDLMTRLLASVVRTGLAPCSFYARPRTAHLDALPVDFVAAALAALSSAGGQGHRTFQVSNGHWDDGVSLDTVMDWVQSAGHPLVRMEDHAAWFALFERRLRELPAGERQRSALPILERWARPLPGWEGERIDASQFLAQVERLRPGGEAEPPHLTEAYLHAYLADLQDLGLVPPPKAVSVARA